MEESNASHPLIGHEISRIIPVNPLVQIIRLLHIKKRENIVAYPVAEI